MRMEMLSATAYHGENAPAWGGSRLSLHSAPLRARCHPPQARAFSFGFVLRTLARALPDVAARKKSIRERSTGEVSGTLGRACLPAKPEGPVKVTKRADFLAR